MSTFEVIRIPQKSTIVVLDVTASSYLAQDSGVVSLPEAGLSLFVLLTSLSSVIIEHCPPRQKSRVERHKAKVEPL